MDKMSLIDLIFYSIPESYLIFTFGLAVLNRNFTTIKIILATVLSVIASYLIRLLPIPFGVHTIIGIFVIMLLFYFVINLNIKESVIAAFISLIMLAFLENTVTFLIQLYFNLSINEIWKNPLLRIAIAWPQLIIWSFITIVLIRKKMHLSIFRGE